MDRKKPFGASGILAALLISPREFLYANCAPCERTLFYTYAGESCPFCGTIVEDFQEGAIPSASLNNGNGKPEKCTTSLSGRSGGTRPQLQMKRA
jgi:hypothetical protein